MALYIGLTFGGSTMEKTYQNISLLTAIEQWEENARKSIVEAVEELGYAEVKNVEDANSSDLNPFARRISMLLSNGKEIFVVINKVRDPEAPVFFTVKERAKDDTFVEHHYMFRTSIAGERIVEKARRIIYEDETSIELHYMQKNLELAKDFPPEDGKKVGLSVYIACKDTVAGYSNEKLEKAFHDLEKKDIPNFKVDEDDVLDPNKLFEVAFATTDEHGIIDMLYRSVNGEVRESKKEALV